MNFIRYPTAIVLTVSGLLLLRAALIRNRHVMLRVLSGGLGALLIVAAADEILQLHERLAVVVGSGYFNETTGISTQDMSTFLVAVAGILVASIAHRIVRSFAERGVLGVGGREVAAAELFLAAGVAFLSAMLLDTFDDVFAGTARAGISLILPEGHTLISGQDLNSYFILLANSIEEILEFTAAVILLSMALVYNFETRCNSA